MTTSTAAEPASTQPPLERARAADPSPLGQLSPRPVLGRGRDRVVALLVAGAGAALLVGVALDRLWDLDKAAHLAFGGVVALALGVGLAVAVAVRPDDAAAVASRRIAGPVAGQVRWTLRRGPLGSTGVVELDKLLAAAGGDVVDTVSAGELRRARRLLTERLESHLRSPGRAEEGVGPALAESDAVENVLRVRASWDQAEESQHRSFTVGVLVAALWRGARLWSAVLLALLGVLLLLTAAQKDGAAELASAAEQHAALAKADNDAVIEQRKQVVSVEADSEVQRHKRMLLLDAADEKTRRKDLALPIEKRMKLHLRLTAADLRNLNKARAACRPFKADREVTAFAIGGTWERPLLDFPPDRTKGCGPVVFHPSNPVDAQP